MQNSTTKFFIMYGCCQGVGRGDDQGDWLLVSVFLEPHLMFLTWLGKKISSVNVTILAFKSRGGGCQVGQGIKNDLGEITDMSSSTLPHSLPPPICTLEWAFQCMHGEEPNCAIAVPRKCHNNTKMIISCRKLGFMGLQLFAFSFLLLTFSYLCTLLALWKQPLVWSGAFKHNRIL